QAPWTRAASPRRAAVLLVAVGASSVVPWFGKPTYVLFTLAQLLALAADELAPGSGPARRRSFAPLVAFALGGAAGAAAILGFLPAYGDVGALARVQLADVPAMYRFIWPRASMDILSSPWCANQAILAFTGAAVLLGLVAAGELPRRAIGVALLPVCA